MIVEHGDVILLALAGGELSTTSPLIERRQCFNGCNAPVVTKVEGQPVCEACAAHYIEGTTK